VLVHDGDKMCEGGAAVSSTVSLFEVGPENFLVIVNTA
jgi:hypothetical protein